ncbi:MAG TPA: choice-of-anchor D domain-containing protein [Candidatus Limnocylindrales bacterium]|nr:choice-of-anchor D domain-containing protein [Candidatus Limnocylindrales bacterium]
MKNRFLATLAAFVLALTGVSPGIARSAPTPSAPDSAPPTAPANPTDQTKVPHYFGPWPNWANSQLTLPDVKVEIKAAGLPVTPVTVGNELIARQYATDDTLGGTGTGTPGQGRVLVIIPTALSDGTLTSFQTYTQTAAFSSSGNSFEVFVLRPTGNPDEYTVVASTGLNTVPVEPDGVHAWPASIPVQQGDYVAFYGQGIPLDVTGPDLVYFPSIAPSGTFTVNSADYPNLGSTRTYSFAATVTPATTVTGGGATATATIGANGAVTALTLTDPGAGYSAADVVITGAGTGASATATVQNSGAVTDVRVLTPGGGYTQPAVAITGGGATEAATATAFGSVDAITLGDPGTGYSFPTVSIDYPDDPAGTQATAHVTCAEVDCIPVAPATTVTISGIVVDNPGSGYPAAPNVAILDGTAFDPVIGGTGATATATIKIDSVALDTFGAGYTSAPDVAITDATGTGGGATASASTDVGAVSALTLVEGGSGYLTPGIKKFEDALPGLCLPGDPVLDCPTTGKYIPLGVAEQKVYAGVKADEFVIGLVQYKTSFSSSLPDTLVRGYIQLETADNADISQHWPVTNTLVDGTKVPVMKADGVTQWLAVTPPQWLGPTILATKDKPVRITFHNLLPTGNDGDLFLPVDSTLMGSGMGPGMTGMPPMDEGTVTDGVRNPMCTDAKSMDDMCFTKNRATLHLHGGITPWISDGTPHQWITPAGEGAAWPEGVSVGNVPDMTACDAKDDGCQTFYYTNQQSARLMFYHDHAWGITRLNVYAGEAAGYLIGDETEQALLDSGTIPADQIPLVVQDRTFVPDPVQLAQQDPTWDTARWGGMGNFWYHHVYMPAQNPGDPSGMSAYGRWMYGPWFWPPATATQHGPIANPYYNMDPKADPPFSQPLAVPCDLDNPATWQYDTDPFCEPKEIPGTPNISVGMEQFNDTPIVNGIAYPTVTLEPKTYRFRVLNAANDRFFNFQWYEGEASTASTATNWEGKVIGPTEVELKAAEVAAAQTDPVVFPTPASNTGPDWIQIGTEGGFLPAPVVVDGQQETTWITDPTRFDVGNVDQHSLLLAPAERADVIVDFSKYAGKTLILYNDAPAAFPARVPSYDYYTGAPDTGAGVVLPGYGPNTRTVMQVKIAAAPAAPAFNLTKLQNAFKHHADGSGVFEAGQHPIIVGQAAYNSAYGTSFAASSNCNAKGSTLTRCDGLVRINDTGTFGFNTLKSPNTKTVMNVEPKAIHDEMNAATFDEFGRMSANLGIEAQPPTPGQQNVTLYPFVNPSTELIDGTNLPRQDIVYDANGDPVSDVKITPIASATDGSQIWRVTHNGVDTHPIHFHLYDVQVLNRVAWDNIITPTDKTELGWKDTVRMNPLQDITVALRPIIPEVPWELPNSIRPLNPMMPLGDTTMFNNVDVQGNPTAPIQNALANFGWEYVYHCHILSHEEMDMMRPVILALPPLKADGLAATVLGVGADRHAHVAWNDNSINETAFLVQRSTDGVAWTTVGTISSPLGAPNVHEARSYDDFTILPARTYQYRIMAENTVGFGGDFPSRTVTSVSASVTASVPLDPPVAVVAPTSLDFGSVTTGTTSASQDVTVSNTGQADLTVTGATIGGTDPTLFSITSNTCTTVTAGGSCTIGVAFAPTAAGPAAATLSIDHNATGSPSVVTLGGTGVLPGPLAAVTPTSLAFGSATTGTQTTSQDVTVSNTGVADLTVTGATLTGTDPTEFTITANTCTTVAAGGSCTISVAFGPSTAGAKSASLSIAHNATGSPSLVALTGTGVAPAPPTTFSLPATQDFGSKAVGASTLKTVLVTNTGPNPLIITSASAPAPFSNVTLGTCTNPVAVGKTCKLTVTFAPTSRGPQSATLTVVSSNATNSPQTMNLTGTGR